MTCPACLATFESGPETCPDCGARLIRGVGAMFRTTAVLVGAGRSCELYPSVEDVPDSVRSTLLESTQSENSGVVVIADRAGRERWAQIVAGRKSGRAEK